MQTLPTQPAILFEPDGYVISGPRLMGRHSAGHGFLRAAVAARGEGPLWAYTPHRRSAEIFDHLVRAMDPVAETRWLTTGRVDLLSRIGALYLPGPGLSVAARLRLRSGPANFSLCGVTHTTASHAAMDAITSLLTAPVMPWDALICTSRAAAATVSVLVEREIESLRWRFGSPLSITLPKFPVIPLGVHAADFEFTAEERSTARRDLGIGDDEVVALFLGRLSFHAKAHPHPMYSALERVAQDSGKKLTLVQCGWFANASIDAAFRGGAARICPHVRALFTDGKDQKQRRQSWAAADLFVSLADNIQETFGLTPVEAMAAGLPVIVTDWDGYRDTVRHGVDGFRIPTRMPSPGFGEPFARGYEAGTINYDLYCGFTCQTVSLDMRALTEHLSVLVAQPELRRRLGESGRQRIAALFDWAVVYRRYQELWDELARERRAAHQNPEFRQMLEAAPPMAAARLDPFLSFAHYPTMSIDARTLAVPGQLVAGKAYRDLIRDPLFAYAERQLPMPAIADAILNTVRTKPTTVETLATQVGLDLATTLRAVSALAKIGLVELHDSKNPGPR